MKKKLIIVLCSLVAAVTLVVVSVMGTVAYLTSSAAVSNVFTVGNVQIVMDESKVNPDGTVVGGAARVDTNTYHLVPGKQYTKDPQIRVNDGSENSYLFVLLRNDLAGIGPKDTTEYFTIAEQMKILGWQEYTVAATGTVFVYNGNADGNTDVVLPTAGTQDVITRRNELKTAPAPSDDSFATLVKKNCSYDLFKYFYTDSSQTSLETYGAAKITLTAVAIQSSESEFGTIGTKAAVDKAWAAVKEAYPYIHTGSN